MKVPTVKLNAAGYQLSSPSSVTPKLLPMIPNGAIDCARPARARNCAIQIMKMKAISCIAEKVAASTSSVGCSAFSRSLFDGDPSWADLLSCMLSLFCEISWSSDGQSSVAEDISATKFWSTILCRKIWEACNSKNAMSRLQQQGCRAAEMEKSADDPA